jgi:hypothetical protein
VDKTKVQKYPDVAGPGFDPSFQLAGTGLDLGLLNASMSSKNIVNNAENAGLLTSNNQNIITSVRSIKQAINNSLRKKSHATLGTRRNFSETLTMEGLSGSSLGITTLSTTLTNSSLNIKVKGNGTAHSGRLLKPQRSVINVNNDENDLTSLYSRGPFLNIVPIGNRDKKSNNDQVSILRLNIQNANTNRSSFIPVPPILQDEVLRSGFQTVTPNISNINRNLVSNVLARQDDEDLSVSSVTNAEPVYHGQSVIIGIDDHRLRRTSNDDEGFSDSRIVMRRNKTKIPIPIRHTESESNNDDDDEDDDGGEFRFSARPFTTPFES